MTPPLRDFVSTYRPPIQPEPFFGFFRIQFRDRWSSGKYYRNKVARNKRRDADMPLITKNYNLHYDYTISQKKKKKPVYKIKEA